MYYDRTVEYAAGLAEKNGWILIQDTAWDGYEQIPGWITQGYLTLIREALEQMEGSVPTHVFLQAGVGSMAGGIEAYLLNRFGANSPAVISRRWPGTESPTPCPAVRLRSWRD